MENLNKGQKIFLAILAIIVIIIIFLYYTKKDYNTDYAQIENIYTENNVQEEQTEETEIIVHIAGEINEEGIIKLKSGSRISDVIEQAGGVTENADLSNVNLAYKVEDGQKINIPNKNEKEYITTENGEGVIISEENETQDNNEKININTATQTQLETLPGIGPSTALKIIEYRKQKGKFNNIQDIKNVSGIGDAKFENIEDYITVK